VNARELRNWKTKIDAMTHEQMAHLYRNAPAGHPVFDRRLPLYKYFKDRFDAFGGMTALISKKIGW